MVETRPPGQTYDIPPKRPAVEHTRVFPAGAIVFGVEQRDESGVSILVCGTDDGYEYLRFDVFADEPHYHYVHRCGDGEIEDQVVHYDVTANGDMLPWVIACLRTRLPEMLRAAGGARVAEQLEMPLVEFVIDVVAQTAEAVLLPPAYRREAVGVALDRHARSTRSARSRAHGIREPARLRRHDRDVRAPALRVDRDR